MDTDKKHSKGWTYSKQFEANQKKIEPDCKRLDDLIDGTLTAIAHGPELLDYVDKEGGLQVCRCRIPDNEGVFRNLSIFFINKPETIYLVDIVEAP